MHKDFVADCPPAEGDRVACPICAVDFQPADLCAADIEMGTCHAACLDGSPIVDLDTGEPTDRELSTFVYGEPSTPARAFLAKEK